MIPIPITVVIAVTCLVIGATVGAVAVCLCVAAGNADDRTRRAERMRDLTGVMMNARFGLVQYPDARDSEIVIDHSLTAGEARAIVALFDGGDSARPPHKTR